MHDKQADPFYSTGRWRRVRAAALARDHGLCRDCVEIYLRNPTHKVSTADVVHHLRPRRTHPELELDLDNLISLCDTHHERRHPERRKAKPARPYPEGIRVIKI